MPPPKPHHSITSLINTRLTFRTTTFPSSALFDLDIDAALSKYQRDPTTLTIKELQSLLRYIGHAVTGKKADLLERLRGTDAILDASFSTETNYPTEIIPFDAIGRDPAILVGWRISRFEYDSTALHLFTCKGCIAIAISTPRSSNPGLEIDSALLEGLAPISDWKVEVRDQKVRVVRRERGVGLVILEAVTAMRKGGRGRGSYRVVGLRCEGMRGMGYVFAREQGGDDAGGYGKGSGGRGSGGRGSGVAVASGADEKGFTF